MSTHQSFTLDESSASLAILPEVLRAILHTIFFQRSVASIKPVEVDSEVLPGLSYVTSNNDALGKAVDDKVAEIQRVLVSQVNVPEHVQVILYFFERHVKRGLFSKSEEKILFEQWIIPLHIEALGNAPSRTLTDVANDTRGRLIQAVRLADAKKEHIPPVASVDAMYGCYPFFISFPGFDGPNAGPGVGPSSSVSSSSSDAGFLKRLVRG